MSNETPSTPPQYCGSGVSDCWHDQTAECDEIDAETSSRRLYRLAKHGSAQASFHASKNPNLSQRHRRRIVRTIELDYRDHFKGGLGVILNPALAAEELAYLVRVHSPLVRRTIAAYSLDSLSISEQMLLAGSGDKEIHDSITRKEGLPQEVYSSSYHYVKYNKYQLWNLAENLSVGKPILDQIIEENRYPEATSAALENPNTPISSLFDKRLAERNPELYDEAIAERQEEVEAWMKEQGFESGMNIPYEWIREMA